MSALPSSRKLGNGYSLSPRLGRQDVGSVGPFGFTDYSLTLGKTFANGLSLSVTALGTQTGQSLYLAPGSEFIQHAQSADVAAGARGMDQEFGERGDVAQAQVEALAGDRMHGVGGVANQR